MIRPLLRVRSISRFASARGLDDYRIRPRIDQSLVFIVGPLDQVRRFAMLTTNLEDSRPALWLPNAIALDHKTIAYFRTHRDSFSSP